jgi:predicted dehydrogenase
MQKPSSMGRRSFLRRGLTAAGAVFAAPYLMPATAFGANDKIVLGAIGIGNRGGYDLGCFLNEPDVQFVAICDVRKARREAVKKMADGKYKNNDCRMYRDFRELLAQKDIDAVLIATGPNWHATASIYAAKAGKDIYCEKPSTKNVVQSLELAETMRRTGRVFQGGMQRRNLPHFQYAIDLALRGKLGKLQSVHAHPGGMGTHMSGWEGTPAPEPPKEEEDWDLWLGPAAWRPYTKGGMGSAFGFEKGGGLVGGGVLEWGSHCIDLCQWANDCNYSEPIEYFPEQNGQATANYANGVKLIIRNGGWLPLGSCPVRFEGDKGWVETGDDGNIMASSPDLLSNWGAKRVGGYPANNHIRDFLDCVKTRGQPKANADVACHTHIACHGANVAIFLKRKVVYDPKTTLFVNDEEANRLRWEALREPWHF